MKKQSKSLLPLTNIKKTLKLRSSGGQNIRDYENQILWWQEHIEIYKFQSSGGQHISTTIEIVSENNKIPKF